MDDPRSTESAPRRILGIDLAAQPERTGVVLLERGAEKWTATCPDVGAGDDELVLLGTSADVVGVDAPLGWPVGFVEAVTAHHRFDDWPGTVDRSSLTHRHTDRVVTAHGWGRPLSASADKLGIVAMRCALLQKRWAGGWGAPAPRDGSARLVETYPAAALRAWRIEAKGYKGAAPTETAPGVRATIVEELGATPWLDLGAVASICVASHDVLDALVCALIAAATVAGATLRPDDHERDLAAVEGWIHVPILPLDRIDVPLGD
jgi:predicted nuclease with RNAse H fold